MKYYMDPGCKPKQLISSSLRQLYHLEAHSESINTNCPGRSTQDSDKSCGHIV